MRRMIIIFVCIFIIVLKYTHVKAKVCNIDKFKLIFFYIFLFSPSDVRPSSVGDAVSLCWLSSGDVLLLFSLQLKNRLG